MFPCSSEQGRLKYIQGRRRRPRRRRNDHGSMRNDRKKVSRPGIIIGSPCDAPAPFTMLLVPLLRKCLWRRRRRPPRKRTGVAAAARDGGQITLIPATASLIYSFLMMTVALSASTSASPTAASASSENYCSSSSPLQSKFLVPFFESHRPVTSGCSSSERTDDGRVVHVISITDDTHENILLTVTESPSEASDLSVGMVLVLESASPVGWRLAFVGSAAAKASSFSRTVVLSRGSTVLSTNLKLTSQLVLENILEDEGLLGSARTEWGAVTSFVETSGANRISILLPQEHLSTTCLPAAPTMTNSHDFDFINSYLVGKVDATGCFHREVAGLSHADVHIVDLDSADGLGPADPSDPVPVYFSMAPEASPSDQQQKSLKRNITLLLSSREPVRWMLQSRSLSGWLRVLFVGPPGSRVEDLQVSSAQALEARRLRLKEASFEELWRAAASETGVTPMSYAKLDRANIISLVIPKAVSGGLSNLISGEVIGSADDGDSVAKLYDEPRGASNVLDDGDDDFGMAEKTVLIPGVLLDSTSPSSEEEEVRAAVRRATRKRCSQSETVVAVRRTPAFERLGVEDMTLADPTCKAEKNLTFWILKSASTSCGSVNLFSGRDTMFRNSIVLTFSTSSPLADLRTLDVPFSCRFRPGLPGMEAEPYYDSGGDEDYYFEDDDGGQATDGEAEMYAMTLVRESDDVDLASRRGDAASVTPGEVLRVETEFDTRAYLSLALEKCWLSRRGGGEPSAFSGAHGDDLLVSEGCPASSSDPAANVTVFPTLGGELSPSFSFRVTARHVAMKRVFLVCLIGLCSPEKSLTDLKVGQCADPADFCGRDDLVHHAPVAQQLTMRGPLMVRQLPGYTDPGSEIRVKKEQQGTAPSSSSSPSSSMASVDDALGQSGDGESSPRVVVVGVATEVAVAIGLASFAVGVVLTGLLCCLHNRKQKRSSPSRRPVAHSPAGGGGDGSELQSMLPPTAGTTSSAAAAAAAPSSFSNGGGATSSSGTEEARC